ncbi:MAG: adaptor protein MecA [Streptococcaceae bacterium]|jgi:adapter protein MecA 1/2|nr:adaptor protein MecA [Streptococcaceae bacterium]
MEMEHIDDHSIRILIRDEDLKQRGINLIHMMGNQKEAEAFFYSIIEEFEVQDKFKNSEQVAFQLIPSIKFQNTIELIVSSGDSPLFQAPLKFLEQLKKLPNGNNKKVYPPNLNASLNKKSKSSSLSIKELANEELHKRSHFILELTDFETVIRMAQAIKLRKVSTDLFEMDQRYFFHVHFTLDLDIFKHNELLKNEKAKLLEFGKSSNLTFEILQEHAKQIIEQNALQTLKLHFK